MVSAFAVVACPVCGKQDPEPVMIKVFESVGEPANLFDDQVESPMCCQAARSVSEAALRWR
jgi:hypothetical protein